MKSTLLVGSVMAVAAAFLTSSIAMAQKVETKNITIKGEITSVDVKAKTITVKVEEGTGKERTLDVAPATKIMKESKINLHIKDLHQGDKVSVMYKKGKELGPDKKTNIEVMKALQITILSSAEPAGAATNTPSGGLTTPSTAAK